MPFDAQGTFDKFFFSFPFEKWESCVTPGAQRCGSTLAANLSHKDVVAHMGCFARAVWQIASVEFYSLICLQDIWFRLILINYWGSVKSICLSTSKDCLPSLPRNMRGKPLKTEREKRKRGKPCVTWACGSNGRGELDSDTRERKPTDTRDGPNLSV